MTQTNNYPPAKLKNIYLKPSPWKQQHGFLMARKHTSEMLGDWATIPHRVNAWRAGPKTVRSTVPNDNGTNGPSQRGEGTEYMTWHIRCFFHIGGARAPTSRLSIACVKEKTLSFFFFLGTNNEILKKHCLSRYLYNTKNQFIEKHCLLYDFWCGQGS